jgi:uncharacterized repeat protein (TIGR01451 family)
MQRWRLILLIGLLILLGGVSALQYRVARSGPASGPTDVAIVQSSSWPPPDAEVEALVRQAVALAGGLDGIIDPGDTVVVKPNLIWDSPPEDGYTTDPRVTHTVVEMAREAGAGEVIIADGAGQYRDWHDDRGATLQAFRVCGYDADGDMIDDVTGAPLIDLNDAGGLDQHDPGLVSLVHLQNGLIWSEYWLPNVILNADVLIGIPVLKNHSRAGVTLALKNQFGIAPSDIYHNPGSQMWKGALSHSADDLGRHIVDLNLARPLDFAVIDGLRGITNGSLGVGMADPPMKLIMAGRDAVALDTIGTLVMGYDPETVPYLGWAAGAGLGTDDVSQITVRGKRVSQVRRNFPAPWGDPQAVRADEVSPSVNITTPGEGHVVVEDTAVWATVSDNAPGGVAKVEFYAGDEPQATVTAPPYQAALDLSAYRGQSVALRAVAYDDALNDAEVSHTVTVVQAPAPGSASFQIASLSIPTYPYADHLTTEYNSTYNMTYPVLDWGSYHGTSTTPVDYELLVLENDYLRVTLLPELGGRVYQMIYKPTGHNELYQNPVIKPNHWGPTEQGWWIAAGGIEWCLPVDEHGYEWGEPWSYDVITSTAGVTVTLRDTTASDRIRATVTIHLPADQAYLSITPRIENPTGHDIDYKYWSNAMLTPGEANTVGADLRFIFSAEQMMVHSSGDERVPPSGGVMDWPVHNGVDFSRLGNWDEWIGFFEYPQAQGGFIGVYDTTADEGVARVFPPDVAQGAKGFGMGWGHQIEPNIWTDGGSTYVELHGGVAPTFWDTASLPAGQAIEWTEVWYPVGDIGTLSAATANGALGVRESGGYFHIGAHTTKYHAAGTTALHVWDIATQSEIAHWELPAIEPGVPFETSVATGGRSLEEIAIMLLDSENNLLVGINAYDFIPPSARVEPLPAWVGTTDFTVSWSGEDIWSGIASYDVQVRDGYEGAWTDWQVGTAGTSATFSGAHGHTYFFRARARDHSGTTSAYGDEEWGQAFTTVLTEAAPVLVTSRKAATPRLYPPECTIAYTVVISNTGSAAASATITDTPPAGMIVLTATLAASSGPAPTYAGGQIHWSGTVAAGAEVRVTYTLSPTAAIPLGQPLTNTVEIAGSVLGPFTRQATVTKAYVLWMPITSKDGPPTAP